MARDKLIELAAEFEAQALVLVEHMRGGYPRSLTTEAADLFAIAAGLRAEAERNSNAG